MTKDSEKLVDEMKSLVAEACKHTIEEMSNNDEAESVAQALEGLANMVRKRWIQGFDWSWTKGTGKIDATNFIIPEYSAKFITINLKL